MNQEKLNELNAILQRYKSPIISTYLEKYKELLDSVKPFDPSSYRYDGVILRNEISFGENWDKTWYALEKTKDEKEEFQASAQRNWEIHFGKSNKSNN